MEDSLTYMRGSKALLAEIENLRDRVSDDPFVPNLRQRQQSLDFYRSAHADIERVRVYRQDGSVESPDRAVKPRKGPLWRLEWSLVSRWVSCSPCYGICEAFVGASRAGVLAH